MYKNINGRACAASGLNQSQSSTDTVSTGQRDVKRFCPYLDSNLREGEGAHVTCTLHGGAVFDLALCIREVGTI
jgi:hypothetical protein